MLSQLTGLLAAAAVDGDLEKGSEIAQKASTYNWLTHREIEDADKARAGCSALGAGACEKKIIRDMDELDKSRNLGMFDLERSLQLSVLRDGMTQGEYREALLDGFNGLDPRDLVFTGYEPANELGYRAEALGSHVVDLAAEFPGRFKAGLEGLINNYDQIPAGIAQSARDGVDWWTGPIPAQAIARAEDKLVFSTPEQLGDRLFDMTLGPAAGAAGGLVGGKAIEWFAGRWATRAGAEGVGAKGAGTSLSPIFKDTDTGLNAVNPITSNNRGRIQDLGMDPDKGKLALHEGQAAVQLENTFGSTLERVEPILGQKNPDFVFTDGPYSGKSVDFMWTDSSRSSQINKFFQNNAAQNQRQLIDHLNKADIVPIDYRNLTPSNQEMVNGWIKLLPKEQQNKILILR